MEKRLTHTQNTLDPNDECGVCFCVLFILFFPSFIMAMIVVAWVKCIHVEMFFFRFWMFISFFSHSLSLSLSFNFIYIYISKYILMRILQILKLFVIFFHHQFHFLWFYFVLSIFFFFSLRIELHAFICLLLANGFTSEQIRVTSM